MSYIPQVAAAIWFIVIGSVIKTKDIPSGLVFRFFPLVIGVWLAVEMYLQFVGYAP